jgi:hypothetical protein
LRHIWPLSCALTHKALRSACEATSTCYVNSLTLFSQHSATEHNQLFRYMRALTSIMSRMCHVLLMILLLSFASTRKIHVCQELKKGLCCDRVATHRTAVYASKYGYLLPVLRVRCVLRRNAATATACLHIHKGKAMVVLPHTRSHEITKSAPHLHLYIGHTLLPDPFLGHCTRPILQLLLLPHPQ